MDYNLLAVIIEYVINFMKTESPNGDSLPESRPYRKKDNAIMLLCEKNRYWDTEIRIK